MCQSNAPSASLAWFVPSALSASDMEASRDLSAPMSLRAMPLDLRVVGQILSTVGDEHKQGVAVVAEGATGLAQQSSTKRGVAGLRSV